MEPGAVSVTRLGRGESCTAWLLRPRHEGSRPLRVVRVPRHPGEELPRRLAEQYEALARVPPDLGARGVALEESSGNPLGAPYLVTTYVPGRVLPPRGWTPRLACDLAGQLARLHHLVGCSPGGGGLSAGAGSLACPDTHPGALREADDVLGLWRARHPHTVEDPRVVRLLGPWLQVLARLDPAVAGTPLCPLIHGDVVVTNVVVGPDGVPRLIDWEWAAPGDPAKDLALLGGAVTGGPWYARLSRKAVRGMVARYVAVRAGLDGRWDGAGEGVGAVLADACGGPAGADLALPREGQDSREEEVRALLARRDAWELLDRMGNLLYCLSRGGRGDYPRWAAQLAESLEARLTALPHQQSG